MDILEQMSVVWPSALRAWGVLNGSKTHIREAVLTSSLEAPQIRHKRSAEDDHEGSQQLRTLIEGQSDEKPSWMETSNHFTQPAHIAGSKSFTIVPTSTPIHPTFLDRTPDIALQQSSQPTPHSQPESSHPLPGFENLGNFIGSEAIANQWANQRVQVHHSLPQFCQQPPQQLPQQQLIAYEFDSRHLPPPQSSATYPLIPPGQSYATVQPTMYQLPTQPPRGHSFDEENASTLPNRPLTDHPFWAEFSANDPFGDPSSLSASLYNVPLVVDNDRYSRGPEVPVRMNAPSMFQLYDRHGMPSAERYGYTSS